MADAQTTARRRRLVGPPLLYSVSVFASLGVFLVSLSYLLFRLFDRLGFD